MFVVGGASLTKSNYERILDSAESMLVKSKQIVQMKKENETELKPIFEETDTFIDNWLQEITELK
jgi:hypothetical protein